MRHYRYRSSSGILVLGLLLVGLASPGPAVAQDRTLYQRLGGLPAISVVVSDFIDVLVPDQVLNRNPAIAAARSRVPAPYLKYQVTALVCQATGGPCQYQGRSMKESHAHLNITEQEWERMVILFKGVLAKHAVPAAEQDALLAIVASTKGDIVRPAPGE